MQEKWMQMMAYMQDIRLFSSLHVRRTQQARLPSAQELDLLSRVALAEQPLTPLALSRSMGVTKPLVSRLLERMQARGFLQKEPAAADKRSYNLRVTAAGTAELERTYAYYLEPVYQLQRGLGQDDFDRLMVLLRKANTVMQEKEKV